MWNKATHQRSPTRPIKYATDVLKNARIKYRLWYEHKDIKFINIYLIYYVLTILGWVTKASMHFECLLTLKFSDNYSTSPQIHHLLQKNLKY